MSERNGGQQDQNHYDQNAGLVDAFVDLSALELNLLKFTPEKGGSGSRIGVDQVSGSDSADHVAGFGQVLTLVFAREERGVSAGCWSAPGNVLTGVGVNLECPASVDSLDSAVGDFNALENVYQSNEVVFKLDSWPVENQPAQIADQDCSGKRPASSPEAQFNYGLNQGKGKHNPHQHGYAFSKSRAENLHLHNDSPTAGVFA